MDCTKRAPVLLLGHGDGWLEIFGPEHIDVKYLDVPYIPTIEGEKAAGQFVENSLPLRYQDIYLPENRLVAAMHRRVRPSSIAQARQEKELLEHLGKIRTQEEGKRIWTL